VPADAQATDETAGPAPSDVTRAERRAAEPAPGDQLPAAQPPAEQPVARPYGEPQAADQPAGVDKPAGDDQPAGQRPAESPPGQQPAEPLNGRQAQAAGAADAGPAQPPPAQGFPADAWLGSGQPPAEPWSGSAQPPGGAWPPPGGQERPAAERWPTAAALIPGTPAPADEPGQALAEEPQQPQQQPPPQQPQPQQQPQPPHLEAADLAGREATIAPSGEPFEAVLLGAPGGADLGGAARAPLPRARDLPPGTSSYAEGVIIQGVYCKNGHFDDPEALFCAVCGISMNQQTLVPRPGPRPPLGVLLLDDGSVFQLDKDYVIGREPSLDASVAAGRSRPLRIADESGIVSRVHARVHLDGWRVLVTDLGSANGTRVTLPRRDGEQGLLAQIPILLAPGSQVDLGGRIFRYESHRGR